MVKSIYSRSGATGPRAEELETLTRLHDQGDIEQAEILSRSLTVRFPCHGFGWKILGLALQTTGQIDESLHAKQKAVELLPDDPESHFNLAYGLHLQRRLGDAVASYIRAIEIKPHYAQAHNNLGNAFKMLGHLDAAETCCRQAVALQPDMANAHNNLGNILQAQGKLVQAQVSYLDALQLKPDWAEAYNNLAICLQDQGLWTEAQACYRKAIAGAPDWAAAHSNLLFCLAHDVTVEPHQLYSAHLAFGEHFESPLRAGWQAHDNSKDPKRCLEVGFVSGDLYDHAVASFLEPMLEFLAQKPTLSLHAYYNHTLEDAVTLRLRSYFRHWHAVTSLTDAELANKIRTDRIDILIDISGHTAHNRLLTFARKPAPIQASWLGYPGTTGLQAMDYYLCDRFWIPPGELDWQFTEKPAYLPATAIFQPSKHAPAVNPLPALANGHITFGSFNRPNKLNPSVIALWSMLLRGIPKARMLLGGIPPDRQEALIQGFAYEGIERKQLIFYPRSSVWDYLALHHQVDICLDTYPYSGGTTTIHAAWMGVPTLALVGETPASRSGATEMHHLDLDGFIATHIEDFVIKGRFWAEHIDELVIIRSGLRARFEVSAMGQQEPFASSFEATLRAMWHRWCDGLDSTPIDITSRQFDPVT